MKIKQITLFALFLALGVIANYIEHLVPLNFILPSVKLGLANSIGLIVLYYFGRKSYLFIGILRIVLSALLFSGFGSTFQIAFGGYLLASLVTLIIVSFTKSSIYGVSVSGAVMHGLGQVIVVCIIYNTIQMLLYMIILAISGVVTGILMAFVSSLLIKKLPKKII